LNLIHKGVDNLQDIESWNIAGGLLEYIDDTHTYIFNGEILPSITQILKVKFNKKYEGVSKKVLQRASELGTAVHNAIEDYEKKGIEDVECVELRNYKFLKKAYKFECIDNEVPVVLFQNNKPVACGRLDLVLKKDEEIGLGDIKRTATLDKNYLAYQLNLYRIAYQQCYGTEIKFLRGLHLRNDTRKYINIPINEELAEDLLNDFLEGN
jgi:hypothetical protein